MSEIRWAIMDRLCLFDLPGSEEEMRRVAEQTGMGLLIQLYDPSIPKERDLDWSKVAADMNFEVKKIEAPDFQAPKAVPGLISELAKHTLEAFTADECVGIHCGYGKGRTGTMALVLMAELIKQSGSCSESEAQLKYIEQYLEGAWMGKC